LTGAPRVLQVARQQSAARRRSTDAPPNDREDIGMRLLVDRLAPEPPVTFFTNAEGACARALLNLLTGREDAPELPILQMVDARLEAGETDGWRHGDMPDDGQAWRDTLAYLDADAGERCSLRFADAPVADQLALIQAVKDLKSGDWHGLNAAHVWSLWTRYACTALYAHPVAWNEISFPGPGRTG